MNKPLGLAISGIALIFPLLLHGHASAWQDALQGSAHGTDQAGAVAVDPTGDVIAVGTTAETATGDDLTVVKLSGATGAEVWRHTVDGGFKVEDSGSGIAIDGEGNIAVAGLTNEYDTIPRYLSTGDFTVLKLSGATGDEIWRYSLANNGRGARAVAFDSSGNVVAVGSVEEGGTYNFLEFFTIAKLAKDTGAELWHQELNDGFPESAGFGVATGETGDVFAVGAHGPDGGSGAYFVTRRAATDGTEVWSQHLQGDSPTLFEFAKAIELDGSGGVLTAGTYQNAATGPDFVVAKLAASTGTPVWSTAIDGGVNGGDGANAIAVDPSGDPVAAGELADASGQNFAVVKLSAASGGEIWRWAGAAGSAAAVRVDAAGDVVAAGVLPDASSMGPRFGVIKLAGVDGVELWRRTLPASLLTDQANDLALTPMGDVVAAGATSAGSGLDFAVVKLAGATGLPTDAGGSVCGNGLLESGELCDDGNRIDGDGCDSDCRPTLRCPGGTSIAAPLIKVARRARTGMGSVRFQGGLQFSPGAPPAFDPTTQGAQVLIEDLGTGAAAVFDLTLRTHPIPPGAVGSGCSATGDGWRHTASSLWSYRDPSGEIDPPACTPGSAHGLSKLDLTDQRSTRGEIDFIAASPRSLLPTMVGPLRGTLILGATEQASDSGACGTVVFGLTQCRVTSNGNAISCK
jgi:cysteine-rich repeat protein